jgi:hypothetical protein
MEDKNEKAKSEKTFEEYCKAIISLMVLSLLFAPIIAAIIGFSVRVFIWAAFK